MLKKLFLFKTISLTYLFIFYLFTLSFFCLEAQSKDNKKNFYNYNIDNLDAEDLYRYSLYNLKKGDTEEAITSLKKILSSYPYKEESINAELLLIWIYYQKQDLVDAEIEIDNFYRYYPYSEYSEWLSYIKGLTYYDQIQDIRRDQSYSEKTLSEFLSLYKKYPDTDYAKDSYYKLAIITDFLAAKEMHIARYYITQQNYVPAIKRLQSIVQSYQTTVYIAEAMYRLVYVFLLLGLDEEAYQVAAVLGYNHRDTIWYQKSYNLMKKYANIKEIEKNLQQSNNNLQPKN
jgi:outer membrane protein assembly factor BamD